MMRAAAVAALLGAAAAMTEDLPPVRQVKVQATHEGHIDGWTLQSVWTLHDDGIQENILSEGPTLKRLRREASALQSVVDVRVPSRARTMLALKLCIAQIEAAGSYDTDNNGVTDLSESEKARLEEMLKENDLFFAEQGTTALREAQNVHNAIKAVHRQMGGGESLTNQTVVAHLWAPVAGGSAVLTFRGAFDTIDYAEAAMFSAGYQLSKSNQRLKHSWTQIAGQEWTETQRSIEARRVMNYSETVRREALTAAGAIYKSKELGNSTVTGLMPVVLGIGKKFIQNAAAEGLVPMLAGYSMGGTRAAGVSMALRQALNITVPTLTFGGMDSSCWPRGLTSGAVYTEQMNPYIEHPQIVDYTHPLDRYGNNQGMEVGHQCWVGLKDDAMLEKVKRWCESTFAEEQGYVSWAATAPMVQATVRGLEAQAKMLESLLPAHKETYMSLTQQIGLLKVMLPGFLTPMTPADKKVHNRALQCNYLAHSPIAYLVALEKEVLADGTTQSGCVAPEAIPRGDARCTWNNAPEPEGDDYEGSAPYYVMIVLLCLAFVVMVVSFVVIFTSKKPAAPAGAEEGEELSKEKQDSSSE